MSSIVVRAVSFAMLLSCVLGLLDSPPQEPERSYPQVSGIYPHLAMFNDEKECGTGGVVAWAGSLWVITYAPHKPGGSSDKLYQITTDLEQIVRPESIGGTPANRLIHRESQQLFLGPYAISAEGEVRVIPYTEMYGRPTGSARHLTDPEGKIYTATMEEGLYEIDVDTLEVTELFADTQTEGNGLLANLPGYHGKGLYSGQGRVVYSNNGEYGKEARKNPRVPSGVLAQWFGVDETTGNPRAWEVVRRNQFTEVTGPGGIEGSSDPASDPIWALGWDHKSVILEVLDGGEWHRYRLPKGSHSYDGAHGWNTEWPRIRDIGEEHLLATMHGTFWQFPRGFRPGATGGLRPLSNYLKVVGDFARWGDYVVFGCDDAAKSEFLNKRRAKGEIAGPGKSQSNLWFVKPEQLDDFGPALGRGSIWLNEDLPAGAISDPFLIAGYDEGGMHLFHRGEYAEQVTLEIDVDGSGAWTGWRSVTAPAGESVWIDLMDVEAEWLRLRTETDWEEALAVVHLRERDEREREPSLEFDGLLMRESLAAEEEDPGTYGLLHARGAEFRTLRMVAGAHEGEPTAVYDLQDGFRLVKKDDPKGMRWTANAVALPDEPGVGADEASAFYVDDAGKKWRFPNGARGESRLPSRVAREVCTERDLFHFGGTFFELPAENAGGFAMIRPIASHPYELTDFVSHRGMLVMSGASADGVRRAWKGIGNPRIVVSDDGKAGLWVGAADDLWKLGRPRGLGGPWDFSAVNSGEWSDPYLMSGYPITDVFVQLDVAAEVELEIDVTGYGDWIPWQSVRVKADDLTPLTVPEGFSAYWIRARTDRDCVATLLLDCW